MAGKIWSAIVALALAWVAYFAIKLIRHRRFYRNLPGAPSSLLFGHAKIIGEYMAKLPKGSYLQAAFTQMKQDYNLPDIFYMDLWPFGPEFVVCTAPEAAAFPTTVNSFTQAQIVEDFFASNLGAGFIEAASGNLWKELHHMIAPGLTPAAVKSYHPIVLEEAKILHQRFNALAHANKVVSFDDEVGKFPFDVTSHIFFGQRLHAQTSNSAIYRDLRAISSEVERSHTAAGNPIAGWLIKRRIKEIVARLDKEIEPRVQSRFAALQNMKEKGLPTRTTAASIVDRMLLTQVQKGGALDPGFLTLCMDNAKGFFAAGWGTTTDTLTYAFMLLSVFPQKLRKVREEHDRVFDKDHGKTFEMLEQDVSRLKDLEYTAAVINETLRLFPIGMVVRQAPEDWKSFKYKDQTYPLTGQTFMIAAHAIHYDPAVFERPKEFLPERHLGTEPNFPRNAHRPFERGLRSCIGQTLAMDEMKVCFLMLARWFDFELLDHNPVDSPRMAFTDLDTIIGDHAYQQHRFSAGVRSTLRMRVSLARQEERE